MASRSSPSLLPPPSSPLILDRRSPHSLILPPTNFAVPASPRWVRTPREGGAHKSDSAGAAVVAGSDTKRVGDRGSTQANGLCPRKPAFFSE
ncbi:hypothetical protein GUJ93_ZPchr0006g43418 [Zizania palustris]|uniref:Uncharacterized protein n=1 Tax=Zizania palustris TaxID=103762 RepID=A0A8J5VNL4_ZIZPA|nr:hypothetical protein GUJ93_ZPchr0006g43418 [Zizania palustris]